MKIDSQKTYGIALALMLLFPCCQQQKACELSEADRQLIEETAYKYNKLWNETADVAAYIQYYATDAIVLAPNEKTIQGHEAIALWGESSTAITIHFDTYELEGSDNMAYARGKYTIALRENGLAVDEGKFIEIWKKQSDGSWKVSHDIFNSDLPVPQNTDNSAVD